VQFDLSWGRRFVRRLFFSAEVSTMATEYTAVWPGVVWHGSELAPGATFTVDGPEDQQAVEFWLKFGKLNGTATPGAEVEQPPQPPVDPGEGGEQQSAEEGTRPISTRDAPSAHVGRRQR
jgi:hypothetical protein